MTEKHVLRLEKRWTSNEGEGFELL